MYELTDDLQLWCNSSYNRLGPYRRTPHEEDAVCKLKMCNIRQSSNTDSIRKDGTSAIDMEPYIKGGKLTITIVMISG